MQGKFNRMLQNRSGFHWFCFRLVCRGCSAPSYLAIECRSLDYARSLVFNLIADSSVRVHYLVNGFSFEPCVGDEYYSAFYGADHLLFCLRKSSNSYFSDFLTLSKLNIWFQLEPY